MTDFKVGDTVKLTGLSWNGPHYVGETTKVLLVDDDGWANVEGGWMVDPDPEAEFGGVLVDHFSAEDPNHYKFPGGVEVRQISAHLTSFGGQALQYIARATRLDGQNKGDAATDLKKAIRFIEWELERLEDSGGPSVSAHIES